MAIAQVNMFGLTNNQMNYKGTNEVAGDAIFIFQISGYVFKS